MIVPPARNNDQCDVLCFGECEFQLVSLLNLFQGIKGIICVLEVMMSLLSAEWVRETHQYPFCANYLKLESQLEGRNEDIEFKGTIGFGINQS